jgi:hypothetical protein
MKRARIFIGIAAALIAVSILPSGAMAAGDVKGPPCADLTPSIDPKDPLADSAAGEGYTTPGDLVVQQQLSKAACDSMTYTLYVLDGTGVTELTSVAGTPAVDARTGYPVVQFAADLSGFGAPSVVCFYMTSEKGTKLLDRAPDTSCSSIALGTTGAPRKYG